MVLLGALRDRIKAFGIARQPQTLHLIHHRIETMAIAAVPSHHGCNRQTAHDVSRHARCRGAINGEGVVAPAARLELLGCRIKCAMVFKLHQGPEPGEMSGNQKFGPILTVRPEAAIGVWI